MFFHCRIVFFCRFGIDWDVHAAGTKNASKKLKELSAEVLEENKIVKQLLIELLKENQKLKAKNKLFEKSN